VRCGGSLTWFITHENIEEFVKSRPWFFDPEKMPDNEFRDIVKWDFARDPWYSLPQACKLIGVSYDSSAMAGYITKGWLHPMRAPIEGGNHWTWLFRKSDINAFLADDPRPKSHKNHYKNLKLRRLNEGRAIEMCMVWQMICPFCKKSVLIRSNPHICGYEAKELFVKAFCVKGNCSHKIGNNLNAVVRPEKPYKVLKSFGRKTISVPNWPARKPKNGVA
jgi:hypothetical protein